MPPCPLSCLFTSFTVYFPLKHSAAKSPHGRPPVRSGEKGPISLALLTSITRPPTMGPTDMPPPRWATTNLLSAYGMPRSLAARRATAFMLKACDRLRRSIRGWPEMRATGSNSSTATGSTINAGSARGSAMALANKPPRLEAWCPCTPCLRSCTKAALTG